jgi:hypothetical protein
MFEIGERRWLDGDFRTPGEPNIFDALERWDSPQILFVGQSAYEGETNLQAHELSLFKGDSERSDARGSRQTDNGQSQVPFL